MKERMGLSTQQIKTIVAARDNFFQKRIVHHAEVQRTKLQMRKLMQQDLPPQKQVLQVMRKARNLRGKVKEERVKTHLKILSTLSADQRKTLRKRCRQRGFRGEMGRQGQGRGQHRGKGRGMGRGMGGGGR